MLGSWWPRPACMCDKRCRQQEGCPTSREREPGHFAGCGLVGHWEDLRRSEKITFGAMLAFTLLSNPFTLMSLFSFVAADRSWHFLRQYGCILRSSLTIRRMVLSVMLASAAILFRLLLGLCLIFSQTAFVAPGVYTDRSRPDGTQSVVLPLSFHQSSILLINILFALSLSVLTMLVTKIAFPPWQREGRGWPHFFRICLHAPQLIKEEI